MVAMQNLDVDVLVERAGQAVAGNGQNTPASAAGGEYVIAVLVSRIAEPKDRERFERPVE